jgi:translation initiation factor 4E
LLLAVAYQTSETIKRVLSLPNDTIITWRSHDESIAQRIAIDQTRQDKTHQEKRRPTINEEPRREKPAS